MRSLSHADKERKDKAAEEAGLEVESFGLSSSSYVSADLAMEGDIANDGFIGREEFLGVE